MLYKTLSMFSVFLIFSFTASLPTFFSSCYVRIGFHLLSSKHLLFPQNLPPRPLSSHQPKQTFAMAMAADKGANGAEGAASSGKKKASSGGKKKKDDGLAALLAEGVSGKGASTGKQGKKKVTTNAPAAASPPVKATADGSVATSNGGTKTLDKSGGASRNESSSVSGANNKNAADGTVVENGGGSAQGVGVEGYTRHWPDEPSVLAFMFRPDLPTDAFTVIAMQLYN